MTRFFTRISGLAAPAALAVAAILPAGPAAAQQVIAFGNGGYACYQHALYGEGDFRAEADCDRALMTLLSPRDTAATYINRAIVRIHGRDYEGALADVERSMKFRDFAEAYATRGVAYFFLGRYGESVEQATIALSRDDLDEPQKVYYNRAVAYERMDRFEEAYYDYMKAAEIAPDWERPREDLARFEVVPAAEAAPSS